MSHQYLSGRFVFKPGLGGNLDGIDLGQARQVRDKPSGKIDRHYIIEIERRSIQNLAPQRPNLVQCCLHVGGAIDQDAQFQGRFGEAAPLVLLGQFVGELEGGMVRPHPFHEGK